MSCPSNTLANIYTKFKLLLLNIYTFMVLYLLH